MACPIIPAVDVLRLRSVDCTGEDKIMTFIKKKKNPPRIASRFALN